MYYTNIAGVGVGIGFPRYPDDIAKKECVGLSTSLQPYNEDFNFWKAGKDYQALGYQKECPKGNSVVKVLFFEMKVAEETVTESAQKLYDEIKKWEISFIDYCDLCSKIISDTYVDESEKAGILWLSHNGKYISTNRKYKICIKLFKDEHYLSENQVIEAIKFASSTKEMNLEYQMLLSAYKALNNGRNRQAVVDACSAVEICLVNQIAEYCNKNGLNKKKILEKDYRTLGKRFTYIKKIDKTFPIKDPGNSIVSYRNKVMHNKDVFPSDETVKSVIGCVEKCLAYYGTNYYEV